MQTAGFISEYYLLDFSCQRVPTNQQGFDAEASFSSFDFGAYF